MGTLHSLPPAPKMSKPLHQENDIIKTGGGNGGGENMLEARVAKLEANVEHIASDTKDIKENLRSTSKDVATLKTDMALSRQDLSGIKGDAGTLKTDLSTLLTRVTDLEKAVNSFKTTIKVSAGIVSGAIVIFGAIAGPYLAKIASILNALALKN